MLSLLIDAIYQEQEREITVQVVNTVLWKTGSLGDKSSGEWQLSQF